MYRKILIFCVLGLMELVHAGDTSIVEHPKKILKRQTSQSDVVESSIIPSFFAYRTAPYKQNGTTIPYDGVSLNIGNVLNITTGFFTAPFKGLYYFYFSCLKQFSYPSATIRLVQNNKTEITTRHVHLITETNDTKNAGLNWLQIDLQATVALDVGETISVVLVDGAIYDSATEKYYDKVTAFTGFLIQPI